MLHEPDAVHPVTFGTADALRRDPAQRVGAPARLLEMSYTHRKRPEGTTVATVTASASRTSEYTEPHRCRSCGKAFWGKRSWNAVTVECPHCGTGN